jgi:hypothetical protein
MTGRWVQACLHDTELASLAVGATVTFAVRGEADRAVFAF